jgi:rhodanese-related sulfurtransferase
MSTITTRQELLNLIAELDSREAVEYAAAEPPADHVRAIPVRRLIAEAPILAPLKLPKPSARDLNGATIKKVLAGKRTAAIVHTSNGVRVVEAIDLDDPNVIVIATRNEVRDLVTVKGKSPVDVARDILDSELLAIAKAAA